MRQNQSYKIIRQLLEQVQLKPRKQDREQMQALLNKELPVHKPVKWFRSARYFIAAGVAAVMVVSAFVVVLSHKNKPVNKQQKTTEQNAAVNNNKSNKQNLNENKGLNKKDEQQADSVAIHSLLPAQHDDENKNDNAVNSEKLKMDSVAKTAQIKNGYVQTNKDKRIKRQIQNSNNKNNLTVQNTITAENKNNKNITSGNDKNSPVINDKITTQHDISATNKNEQKQNVSPGISHINITGRTDTNAVKNLHQQSKQDTAAAVAMIKSNGTGNALSKQKTKNVKNKKAGENNNSFDFGLQVSPLQYYISPADKKLSASYIPGLYGEYFFTKSAGINISVLPYQPNSISNTNIFTDSSRNNDTSYTSVYSLNKLHVLTANLSLVYQQKNFSLEAGIGITPVLSGDGKLRTVRSVDTFHVEQTTGNMHYHKNDVAFKLVNKSMFNFHLTAWYNLQPWQFGISYYQDAKKWIDNSAVKPVGRIELGVRYSLSNKQKK